MNELKQAINQIEMSNEQQQRLLHRIRQEAEGQGRSARKSARHRVVLAGIAVCLLIAIALPLLTGVLSSEPELSLIAYAADQPGVTLLEGQSATFHIDDTPSGGNVYYGAHGDFGGGETLIRLRLVCQGEGVASIAYSSEDCEFTEVLLLLPGDPLYNVSGKEAWEKHRFYLILGPGGDLEGNITRPEKSAYIDLGRSYSVAYDQQEQRDYLVRLPLFVVEPRFETEDGRYVGGVYGMEDATITVDITMENGKVYTKTLLLQGEIDSEYYENLKYFFLPEGYNDLSEVEQKALRDQAIEQGYNSFVQPGYDFDPYIQPRFPNVFTLTVVED